MENQNNWKFNWKLERDFIDSDSGITVRLERRIDFKPTQYRWVAGFMQRPNLEKGIKDPKFIPNARLKISRENGVARVLFDGLIISRLFSEMHEYVTGCAQMEEDEFIEERQRRESRRDGPQAKPVMGLKRLAEQDRLRREAAVAGQVSDKGPAKQG